jgi:hypothetical protein
MNITLIVLFVATLALGSAFADMIRNMIHRLASAVGLGMLLGKPGRALAEAMRNSKVAWFRAVPGKRGLLVYMAYALAWAAIWAFVAYHTGRITLIVGLATYSALMAP